MVVGKAAVLNDGNGDFLVGDANEDASERAALFGFEVVDDGFDGNDEANGFEGEFFGEFFEEGFFVG